MNEEQVKVFESLLEKLREELFKACTNFDIFIQLWHTQEVVDVINQYIGFFWPTRWAHFDQFTIRVSELLGTKQGAPSFYNVFRMLSQNALLASNIDVRSLSNRLKENKEVVKAIKQYRNTVAAHAYTQSSVVRKPVLFGKAKRMLQDLQDIFNEISIAHGNRPWSFKAVQHDDASQLLKALKVR